MDLKIKNLKISGILLLAFLIFPINLSKSATKAEVELPIAEIEALIQQLEDVGANLVGEAGNQMRDVIREASEQARQRIDQIKDASIEVIQEARAQLEELKDSIMEDLQDLLDITNEMVENAINCIDEALANRIAQVSGEIDYLLSRTELILQAAIDRVYVKSSLLIDQGSERVALVANSTFTMVGKIAILVLAAIMLFWLIKMIYQGKLPESKAMKIIMPAIILALVGGGVYLMVSKTALPRLLGSTITLPNPDFYCEEGDRLYEEFFDAYNSGSGDIARIGEEALTALSWCSISSVSSEVAQSKESKKDEIAALLYPVPDIPSRPEIEGADCGEDTPSIHPGWLRGDLLDKYKIYKDMYRVHDIPPDRWVINPNLNIVDQVENYMRIDRLNPVKVDKVAPELRVERPNIENITIIKREGLQINQ